jgi:hypothetical protein
MAVVRVIAHQRGEPLDELSFVLGENVDTDSLDTIFEEANSLFITFDVGETTVSIRKKEYDDGATITAT